MVGTHSPPAELVCGGLSGGWGFAFGSRVREDLCVRGCVRGLSSEELCAQLQSPVIRHAAAAHAAARCAVAYSLSHVARLCTAVGCGCGVEGNEEARPAPRRAQVLLVECERLSGAVPHIP